MKLSFIKSRQKRIIQNDTKVWVAILVTIITILISANVYISIEASSTLRKKIELDNQKSKLEIDTKLLNTNIDTLKANLVIINAIHKKNDITKDSIKNVLEIIPEDIFISRMESTSNSLRIYGYTPTKEIYYYLMSPPLVSIFDKSGVIFTPKAGGGFGFISMNVLEHERLEK
jgi:hypothetical protein